MAQSPLSIRHNTPSALSSPADLAASLRRHADNPSAFLALNSKIEYFTVPGIDGFVAYRRAGRSLRVQFGGVFAPADDQDRVLRCFLDDTRRVGARSMAVQLVSTDIDVFQRNGFRINQLGSSYALDLQEYSLAGKHFVQLRNKISRARRAGVEVTEVVGADEHDRWSGQLADIDRKWLAGKGRGVHELAFLIGERGGAAGPMRRLFVATVAGSAIAYVSYSPAFGSRPGWLYDLTRRVPTAPPGVMELILHETITSLRTESPGAPGWLHFGFTPFTGLADEHRIPAAGSPTVDLAVRTLARYGNSLYPAADQVAYKLKWRPAQIAPDYLAFHGRPRLTAIVRLLRLTHVL